MKLNVLFALGCVGTSHAQEAPTYPICSDDNTKRANMTVAAMTAHMVKLNATKTAAVIQYENQLKVKEQDVVDKTKVYKVANDTASK